MADYRYGRYASRLCGALTILAFMTVGGCGNGESAQSVSALPSTDASTIPISSQPPSTSPMPASPIPSASSPSPIRTSTNAPKAAPTAPAKTPSCRHRSHISNETISDGKWNVVVDVPKYLCRDEVLHFFWARYELVDAGTYRLAQSGRGTLDWSHRSKVVNTNIKGICSAYFLIEGRAAIKQTIALGDRDVGPDYALTLYGRSQTREGWLIAERHNREYCLA